VPLVLLVDDDPDLLELAELVLAKNGLRIVTARDGRRALAALESVEPDVVVTDMMMPELDGLEFIERYMRREPSHAPVIAVSAFAPYLEQARALGADATLPKPYSPSTLARMVHELTEDRRPAGPIPEPPEGEREAPRLQAVLNLNLDVDPELHLQPFLDDVAATYGVPVAGLSGVTEDRQKLVERCSSTPPDPGGPREDSFCTHAIAARAALVVQDARQNPFFKENPSVTRRGFSFYAGVPLMAAHGEAVGTLCILDFEPRHFTYLDLELLGLLARRVMAAFERREAKQQPGTPPSAYRHLQSVDDELDIFGKSLFTDLLAVQCGRGLERDEPVALAVFAAPRERLPDIVASLRASGGFMGRVDTTRIGWVIVGKTAEEARSILTDLQGEPVAVTATDLHLYSGATGLALLHVEQALGRQDAS
jgi:CheY-like chemotaxis protein